MLDNTCLKDLVFNKKAVRTLELEGKIYVFLFGKLVDDSGDEPIEIRIKGELMQVGIVGQGKISWGHNRNNIFKALKQAHYQSFLQVNLDKFTKWVDLSYDEAKECCWCHQYFTGFNNAEDKKHLDIIEQYFEKQEIDKTLKEPQEAGRLNTSHVQKFLEEFSIFETYFRKEGDDKKLLFMLEQLRRKDYLFTQKHPDFIKNYTDKIRLLMATDEKSKEYETKDIQGAEAKNKAKNNDKRVKPVKSLPRDEELKPVTMSMTSLVV